MIDEKRLGETCQRLKDLAESVKGRKILRLGLILRG